MLQGRQGVVACVGDLHQEVLAQRHLDEARQGGQGGVAVVGQRLLEAVDGESAESLAAEGDFAFLQRSDSDFQLQGVVVVAEESDSGFLLSRHGSGG